MNLRAVRSGLHGFHVVTVLALLATGFLLMEPDLRARVLGGYGRTVHQVHLWASAVFVAAPLLALLLAPRGLLGELTRRRGPPDPRNWRKLHIVSTLVLSAALVVSGVVLWLDEVPLRVLDAALWIHEVATWLLTGSVPIHLFAARRKIRARTAQLLGLEVVPKPELPFEDPDDA